LPQGSKEAGTPLTWPAAREPADVVKRLNEELAPAPELTALFRVHADLCRALGNQHRLAILCALKEREMCVSELALALEAPLQSVSQHLHVLKEHKVLRYRREGQTVFYSVTNRKFLAACTLMREAIVEQHHADEQFMHAAALLAGFETGAVAEPEASGVASNRTRESTQTGADT
jgi:ArsR family transcriptional regulator